MSVKTNRELEWRKVPSLLFLYEVNENGTAIRNVKSKRNLKCFRASHNSNTEYWCTQVKLKGRIHKVFIHRVVAECWLGPRPEGMQVDHINRNSLDNRYSNLRYVTKSEQMLNRNYPEFQEILLANLAKGNRGIGVVPVRLVKAGEESTFPSCRKAAKYLASVYPWKNAKSFSDKFHARRNHIFDYDVTYLSAETGHGNQEMGKEQSTEMCI